MEVIRQDNLQVYQIANYFKNSNTFIIAPAGSDKVWLVDIGDYEPTLSVIGNKTVEGIFLTHAHLDHIYGIKDVLRKFPNCVVYGSGMCLEYLFDDKKNLSFYYERPLLLDIDKCRMLPDNNIVHLYGDISIERFYTPGHTPDSACYQIKDLIFTGDAYIPGLPTVTKLRGGNKQLAFESISLIKTRINSSTIILPGHGNVTIIEHKI